MNVGVGNVSMRSRNRSNAIERTRGTEHRELLPPETGARQPASGSAHAPERVWDGKASNSAIADGYPDTTVLQQRRCSSRELLELPAVPAQVGVGGVSQVNRMLLLQVVSTSRTCSYGYYLLLVFSVKEKP